jgi:hypothetical protein
MNVEQTERGTVLSEQVMLASVHVSQGSKKVRDLTHASKLAAQEDADNDLVNVTTSLLNKAFPRSTKLAGLIYAAHRTLTFQLPRNGGGQMKGPGVLANKLAERYLDEITDLINQFDTAADEECEALPAFVSKERHRLGKMFDFTNYPDPDTMRERFGASVHLDGLPKVESISAGSYTQSQQSMAQEKQDQIADSMGKQILIRLLEHVSHMANVTGKENGKVFNSLLGNVRELAEVIIPCCNVNNDPELTKIAADLRKVLVYSDDQIRNAPTARQHVAKESAKVAAKIGEYAKAQGVTKADLTATAQQKAASYF